MTREEVIEQLQDAKIGYKEYLSADALDIAIKALEHPEKNVVAIVPCGDAISREAVLKLQYRIDDSATLSTRDVVNVEDIQALPSVTPQPCEDAVSRQAVLDLIADYDLSMGQVVRGIHALPSVTPQEPVIRDNGVKAELNRVKDELEPTTKNDVVALDFSDAIDTPNKYQTADGKWHEGKIPTTKNNLAVETTQMIDKSNFSQEQYKADLQSAYDCGYAQAKNDLGVELISRADVLQILLDYDYANENALVIKDIKALPSVTPQEPRWVPVSEKLPEPFTFVNATCRSLVDDRENWVVETLYLPIPKEVNKHGYSDWGNIPMLNWGDAEVIAWVERIIPQPYKVEIEPQESEG